MMTENLLICPVCRETLLWEDKRIFCSKGHSFDKAKEGYFYLITKQGYSLSGDSAESVRARREFLNSGYYSVLAKSLVESVEKYGKKQDVLTDACCGEGYYSGCIKKNSSLELTVTGFDLSKSAVKLAAKAYPENLFYTANISSIPQKTSSADILLHSFAPVHNEEFSRILKKDGLLIDVIPSKRHLWQLKEVLYEKPYENDEKSSVGEPFRQIESIIVTDTVVLDKNGVKNVLFMTPYAYKTAETAEKKLLELDSLTTEIGFVINIYRNTKDAF